MEFIPAMFWFFLLAAIMIWGAPPPDNGTPKPGQRKER